MATATLDPDPMPGDLPPPDLPTPGQDVPGDLPAPDLPGPGLPGDLPSPALPAAARRALAEAEARRIASAPPALAPEVGGRQGPEPVRFGDWELKGLAIDF